MTNISLNGCAVCTNTIPALREKFTTQCYPHVLWKEGN